MKNEGFDSSVDILNIFLNTYVASLLFNRPWLIWRAQIGWWPFHYSSFIGSRNCRRSAMLRKAFFCYDQEGSEGRRVRLVACCCCYLCIRVACTTTTRRPENNRLPQKTTLHSTSRPEEVNQADQAAKRTFITRTATEGQVYLTTYCSCAGTGHSGASP